MADITFTATSGGIAFFTWTFTGESISYSLDGGSGISITSGASTFIDFDGVSTMTFSTTGDWTGVTGVNLNNCLLQGDINEFLPFTNVTSLILTGNQFAATPGCIDTLTKMTSGFFNNNLLTEAEVDYILASAKVNEAAGLPGRDCTLYLHGSNVAASSTGLTDAFELTYLADWTVAVNSTGSTVAVGTQAEIEAIGTDGNTLIWNYIQTVDVAATGTWSRIGTSFASPFTGNYNGNGKKITGVSISLPGTNYVGVFGCCTGACNIYKLGVEGTVEGADYVGLLAGYSGGTLSQCYSNGSATGSDYVGGLCGSHEGLDVDNLYSRASVDAYTTAGGLFGAFSYCNMENCYSVGAVQGVALIGGLVGYNEYASDSDCFWDTETSGQASSVRGTGKTTAEMQTQETFTNWYFINETENGTEDIWYINENDYPLLYLFFQETTNNISTISTITIGAGDIAVAYPEGTSEFSTPNTLYCSYADPLDEITPQNYEQTMNWMGIPLSVSKFYNVDFADTSADHQGYYFAIDIIKITDDLTKTSDTDDSGVAQYFSWNGHKLQASTDGYKYYINVIDTGSTAVATNRLTIQGNPQATGENDEWILNDSGLLMSDIDIDPNNGILDIKSINLGGVPISVGRVNDKYYLIVKEVLVP